MDSKPQENMLGQTNEQVGHGPGDEEADHENDNEYTHTSAPYNGSRGSYSYNPSATSGSLHGEHAHLSPEMTGSPHQNGSGRATPRTTATGQTQWTPGYTTPQRAQQPSSSNLYSVMSDTRGSSANGNATADAYQAPTAVPTYPSQYAAATNGVSSSNKRGRDDDDEQDPYGRPSSREVAGGDDIDGLKRRKTMREGSVGGAVGGSAFDRDPNRNLQRTRSAVTQRVGRR